MYVMPGKWQQVVTHLALSCQAAKTEAGTFFIASYTSYTKQSVAKDS